MDDKTAYIFSQSVSAMIELEGMKAANIERERQGLAPAYGEEAFRKLSSDFCISHNDVIAYLYDRS